MPPASPGASTPVDKNILRFYEHLRFNRPTLRAFIAYMLDKEKSGDDMEISHCPWANVYELHFVYSDL
jgi:hypothetical protein